MRNGFGGITQRQQSVAELQVCRVEIRLQLESPFERGDGGAVVVELHQLFAKVQKRLSKFRIGFRCLAKFRDSRLHAPLLVSLNASLHMLGALGRDALQCQPKKEDRMSHDCSASRISRNWLARTSFRI